MKVFLDSNVFLDTLVLRENIADNENAALLMKYAGMGGIEFYISPITVSNSFYITRKDCSAVAKIKRRLENISVLPVDSADVKYAIDSPFQDKEDAMQMSCASKAGCDLILTRDTKHFVESPLPVLTPSEFISRCSR